MAKPPATLSPTVARIAQEFAAQGMTEYRLAQLTGISITGVRMALRGESSPSITKVEAMCRALGLHLVVLSAGQVEAASGHGSSRVVDPATVATLARLPVVKRD